MSSDPELDALLAERARRVTDEELAEAIRAKQAGERPRDPPKPPKIELPAWFTKMVGARSAPMMFDPKTMRVVVQLVDRNWYYLNADGPEPAGASIDDFIEMDNHMVTARTGADARAQAGADEPKPEPEPPPQAAAAPPPPPPPRPTSKQIYDPWPDKSVLKRHAMTRNRGATLVPPPEPPNIQMRFVPPVETVHPNGLVALAREIAANQGAKSTK
jgi:hypothetical protein